MPWSEINITKYNFIQHALHGRPQKFFQGGQSRHFACLFQVIGDATQKDVYKKENVQRYGNSCMQCFLCKKILH